MTAAAAAAAAATPGAEFSFPITDEMVAGYSNIIARPMDLTTLERRLQEGLC